MTIPEAQELLKTFQDKKFKFDPVEHMYTYDGTHFYGVTSFLDRFVKPFDENYWSKKKADERGVDQSVVLNEWKETRDRACDLGHQVHEYIENWYEKGLTELPSDEEARSRCQKWHSCYAKKLYQLEDVGSEIRVFSKKWKLAGTMDKLYYYKGKFIVGDWKTNKAVKTDKDWCFDKLLPPFEQLKSNEINKYSLQISLYRLMLEEVGIKTEYGFICHIPPGESEAEIYKLKDLRVDLRYYLDMQWTADDSFNIKQNTNNIIEKLW